MKYKLGMYGWSLEATGHSLSDAQVKSIQDLMNSNDYIELWEVRNNLEEDLEREKRKHSLPPEGSVDNTARPRIARQYNFRVYCPARAWLGIQRA